MAEPSEHQDHNPLASTLMLGASAVAAAISLAPTVLPFLGIGDPFLGDDASNLMHVHQVAGAAPSFGSGLAGIVNTGISHIPVVGQTLVENSYASLGATAGIGIGGVLLANWLAKREDPHASIHWSKVIRTVSLATSALIALPSILTGISTGLTYFGLLFGGATSTLGGSVAGAMTGTLGVAAGHTAALSLLGVAIPHLLICGAIIAPIALAVFMGHKKTQAPIQPKWTERLAETSVPAHLHGRG